MRRKYRETLEKCRDIQGENRRVVRVPAGTGRNRMCSKETRMGRGKVAESEEEQ
jgi:hypothetical protein